MTTVRAGDFEWDSDKAETNARKHGVSFEEAATAFEDPAAVLLDDPKYDRRYWLIGFSVRTRMLLVVHTESGERTRIISARKAERHEAKLYRSS